MFELKILTHFAAAHQLTMVAEQCENLHGHNWKVEVCVIGEELNAAGVLMDFGVLKGFVAEIIQELDHKFLNDLDWFEGAPSSEKIAVHIAQRLKAQLEDPQYANVSVNRVTAWESDTAAATYRPSLNR